MAGSTGGRCTPSCGASIPTCCAGPGRSSSDCAHTSGLKPGGRGSPKGSLRCSSTGHGCANSRSDGSDEKSGVKGDFHAPFRGSPGLRCPGRPDYAFDKWLEREFPLVEFERYADDAVVHCATEQQARKVLAALEERMAGVGLQLHPDKTRIVYCKDRNRRRSDCAETSFTFLGYTFRARQAPARQGGGALFSAFLPAVSRDALKRMNEEVRAWRIHLRTATELDELAAWINPVVRGWMTYYGKFYRTALNGLLRRISTYLVRWARQKYRRLRTYKKARKWWDGLTARRKHSPGGRRVMGGAVSGLVLRGESLCGWLPGAAEHELGQDFHGAASVLAGGVDVAADVEAVLGGVVAGEAAGDVLLGFQGADAAL